MRFKIQIEKELIDKLYSIKEKIYKEDSNRIRNGFLCSKLLLDKNYSIYEIVGVLDTLEPESSEKISTTLNLNAEAYEKLGNLSGYCKKSMADIVRAIILLNCKSTFREKVTCEQEWNGQIIRFDPDSSPEAWDHYRRFYNYLIKEKFEIKFHEYMKVGNYRGEYINKPIKYYNRLQYLLEGKSDTNSASSRISGETDFNFNDKKYDIFMALLYNYYSGDQLEQHISSLNFCADMHNTLVNFSIMQVMGNMQRYKSRGIKEEWLDRVDSLVYLLDEFYKIDKKYRGESEIIKYGGANGEVLLKYLNQFKDLNDYCKKIYFIDEKLTEEMVKSGQLPIHNGKRVVEYIELAKKFWKVKEDYFNNSK